VKFIWGWIDDSKRYSMYKKNVILRPPVKKLLNLRF